MIPERGLLTNPPGSGIGRTMDNIIRPIFGQPRRTEPEDESRVEVLTQRVYGEAGGCRVCLVHDEGAPEGDVYKVVAGLLVVRQHSLASQAQGPAHWAAVRTELSWEVKALVALVRYLATYSGTHIPVPADVLVLVSRRLEELRWKIADYYPGLL